MRSNQKLRCRALLDLPTELLCSIIDAIDDSQSLAFFSRTCYKAYRVASPRLYRSIGWDGKTQRFSGSAVWDVECAGNLNLVEGDQDFDFDYGPRRMPAVSMLLRSVVKRSKIRDSIKDLSFTYDGQGQYPFYLWDEATKPTAEELEPYKAILQASNILHMTHHWLEGVDEGDVLTYMVLILLNTTNLRRLRVHSGFIPDGRFLTFLSRLITPTSPLQNLESLHIPGDFYVDPFRAATFFQLPKLRTIELAIRHMRSFSWSAAISSSSCPPTNITSLSLQVQRRDPDMLETILSLTPHLKHFQYIFSGLVDGPVASAIDQRAFYVECGELGDILQRHVSSTLKSLKVRARFESRMGAVDANRGEYAGVGSCFGDTLTSLPRLEEIIVPLIGVIERGEDRRISPPPEIGRLLPSSVRSVRFTLDGFWSDGNEWVTQEEAEKWVGGLLAGWREELPGLEKVKMPVPTEEGRVWLEGLGLPEGILGFDHLDYRAVQRKPPPCEELGLSRFDI